MFCGIWNSTEKNGFLAYFWTGTFSIAFPGECLYEQKSGAFLKFLYNFCIFPWIRRCWELKEKQLATWTPSTLFKSFLLSIERSKKYPTFYFLGSWWLEYQTSCGLSFESFWSYNNWVLSNFLPIAQWYGHKAKNIWRIKQKSSGPTLCNSL